MLSLISIYLAIAEL